MPSPLIQPPQSPRSDCPRQVVGEFGATPTPYGQIREWPPGINHNILLYVFVPRVKQLNRS